ncbi:(2Fe-2S)-binding protein [Bradyrhizobium sp. C9]|uniref:(2Fe-2S)-binding protein n=1 Tax=Bradyrhizobium sp. C9 TaxID=142585 RepID=UPI000BE9DCAF|nr:(2Fe-2S)-binding protein [Bradyrhizobium sp. C9]PDT73433.1 hypothetical protein CO675_30695 [Bradyrhizobium sp. C9]
MTQVSMTVNGGAVVADVEPRTLLADFLRGEMQLTGTHLGCEQGVCGACTVVLDGRIQRSCITFAADCDGADVTTIEGFDDDPTMEELREAFSEHHALQCGFCTPGMLTTARDIVLRLGDIDERALREELSGNLCRCTGYVGIVAAIKKVATGRSPTSRPRWHRSSSGSRAQGCRLRRLRRQVPPSRGRRLQPWQLQSVDPRAARQSRNGCR